MQYKIKNSKYPLQIIIDRRLGEWCKKESLKIPNCPRPEIGSINHFVKTAIYEKLSKTVSNTEYLKSLIYD